MRCFLTGCASNDVERDKVAARTIYSGMLFAKMVLFILADRSGIQIAMREELPI